MSIWFAAAASLVIGILVGFASGYRAGQPQPTTPIPTAQQERSAPAPTSAATPSGQSFSESSVADPVRIDPDPIVPAPATPSKPAPTQASKPVPAQAPKPVAPPPQAAERAPARQTPPAAPRPAVERQEAPRQAPAALAPTGPGSVRVLSRPAGAQVILDGRPVGKTPLEIGAVPPGEHTVRIELPGFKGWMTTVDVKPGAQISVQASLEE